MLLLERWTFRTADVSIATNESYRRIAIERGGMAAGARVRRAQRPEAATRLQDRAAGADAEERPRFLVGYVGVMGKQEGIDLLLERCGTSSATAAATDVHFGLVGGGTELETMQELAQPTGSSRTT